MEWPGVTQEQLFSFLKERNSKLWMDSTGASPRCSLIGNTMERGFGHTPYGDHFAHTCGLEVVLPDGEVIETGQPAGQKNGNGVRPLIGNRVLLVEDEVLVGMMMKDALSDLGYEVVGPAD